MAKWTDPSDMPRVPAAMIEQQTRRDEILLDSMREPLYAQMSAWEPDEHTTDLGVGAADMECVFQIHAFEDEKD